MKAKKIKRYLEEFLNELDDIDDEKEIYLRSSTYRIEDQGRFFLGFVGYDGGYLALSDLAEQEKEEDEDGFTSIEDFSYYLYSEEYLNSVFPNIPQEEILMALGEIFYDQDIETLYNDFFVSLNRKSNLQDLINDIKEII